MKSRFVYLLASFWMICSAAGAQDPAAEPSTVYAPSTAPVSTTTTAPPPPSSPEDEGTKRKVYSKKVRGFLWLEGTAGWARVEPNNFKSITINRNGIGTDIRPISEEGPEFGVAAGIQLSSFTIGMRYKTAKLDTFNFNTLAADLGFMLRFVPYVHPFFRILLAYNFTENGLDLNDGDPRFTNVEGDGGGGSIGGGLRIPIIKWISIDAAVDYSIYGLYVRGDDNGNRFKKGMAGSELSLSAALTLHFIQRHKN
jgi:hypothetical protein